jgi:ABC-type multidrug transport system permease subunit
MMYIIVFVVATNVLTIKEIFYPIRRDYNRITGRQRSFIAAVIYYTLAIGMSTIFSPIFFYLCIFSKERCTKIREATLQELFKFDQ